MISELVKLPFGIVDVGLVLKEYHAKCIDRL